MAVDAADPTAAVAGAFDAVAPLLVPYVEPDTAPADLANVRLVDDQGRKEGSLHEVSGQVVRVADGQLTVVNRPSAELRALIGLRDAAVALLDAESDWDRPDAPLAADLGAGQVQDQRLPGRAGLGGCGAGGQAGTGKSHNLIGLGTAAIHAGHKVRYFTAADLVETLYRGLADNTVGKIIESLLRLDLIVVDLCRPRNYADTGMPDR